MKAIHSISIHPSQYEMTFDELNQLATSLAVVANFKPTVIEEVFDHQHRLICYDLVSRSEKAQLEFENDLTALQQMDRDAVGLMMSTSIVKPSLQGMFGIAFVFPQNLDRYPVIKSQVEIMMIALISTLDLRTEDGRSVSVVILENKAEASIPQTYAFARARLIEIFSL